MSDRFTQRNQPADTYPTNPQRAPGAGGYNEGYNEGYGGGPTDGTYQGRDVDRYDNGPPAARGEQHLLGQGTYQGGEFGRGGVGARASGPGFDRDRNFDHDDYGRTNVGGGGGGGGYNNDPRFDQGHNVAGAPGRGGMPNEQFAPGGPGAGAGQNQPLSSREASKLQARGKLEQIGGTLLSSQTMKSKGLAKENEGRALKQQAQEVEQAERLEGEARTRKGHGAPGGIHPTQGIHPTRGAGGQNY